MTSDPEPADDVVEQRTPPPDTRGNDLLVLAACALAAAAAIGFAVGLLAGAPLVLYGTALAVALFALAVAVRRYFAAVYPRVDLSEPRSGADEDAAEREGRPGPLAEVGPVRRRGLLQGLLLAAGGLLAAAFAVPVTTLGPRPRTVPGGTGWAEGVRVVTPDGRPIRADGVPVGGLGIVWPEGAEREETASVILVRLPPDAVRPPTNPDWVVNGELVAYSKVCTHVGCPVGLFQAQTGSLFCPCHQQSFDAARGASPIFGPAARALPQLPLGVDADGHLVALADFTEPVGPTRGSRS